MSILITQRELDDYARTRLIRVYCPGCGEVRYPGGYVRQKSTAVFVHAHNRYGADAPVHCPGGTADRKEDRAP